MLGTDAMICGESETGWLTFFAATRASDGKAIRLHNDSHSALTSQNSKAISEQQIQMKCRAEATHAVERIYKSSQKIYRQLTFFAQHHLQTLMRKDFRMIDQLQEVPTSDISSTDRKSVV